MLYETEDVVTTLRVGMDAWLCCCCGWRGNPPLEYSVPPFCCEGLIYVCILQDLVWFLNWLDRALDIS